jgi:hypothetical protein
MKIAVILFHSNIKQLYKQRWIDTCLDSIINQTYNDFTFYEINYGGDGCSVLENKKYEQKSKFWNLKKNNHAEAMNFLFDRVSEDDCDLVFNINLDDFYDLRRFEIQIDFAKQGYDITSSDFSYIQEIDDFNDNLLFDMNVSDYEDINFILKNHLNIIAHPSVCYSKNFVKNNRYDSNRIPEEDWDLWKRTCDKYKFTIINEVLLYYRRHSKQITK